MFVSTQRVCEYGLGRKCQGDINSAMANSYCKDVKKILQPKIKLCSCMKGEHEPYIIQEETKYCNI